MTKKSVNKYKTYTYKISDELKKEMVEYFEFKKRDKTPPYAVFQADEEDTVVTLYESNKVVFQGLSADIDAEMWKQREKALTGKYPEEKKNLTGITFEPWHFRFVGVDVATEMKSKNICFEEYVSSKLK